FTPYRAVLIAESAVAWFAEASPNEHATIASSGRLFATPRRRPRAREKARPIALGRWLATVEVCGGTHSARLPQTLCRPCAIGSSAEAAIPSRVSKIGVSAVGCRARAIISAPDR